MAGPDEPKDIKQRIETFLGEFRIIVPALGALFGFQLIVAFQQPFERFDRWEKWANFAGLSCTLLSLLFLLIPASYHRFTKKLEETMDFLRFAEVQFGIAFVFLPLGLGLAMYVQAYRTFENRPLSAAIAGAILVTFVVGWWLGPWRRARMRAHALKQVG